MPGKEKSPAWGGKRAGSGRKRMDDEPKASITFSVPTGVKERIRELVRAELARYREERNGGL